MSVDNKAKISKKPPIPVASEKARQEENSPKEATTYTSRNRDKTRALFIILALVVVVGMLIYVYPKLSSLLGFSQQTSNSEAELMNRIEHLEDHTKKLTEEVAEVQQQEATTDNKVAAEVAMVQRFEERLQRLEAWQLRQQHDLKVTPQSEESQWTIPQPTEEDLKTKVQEVIERSEKLEAAHQHFKSRLQRLPEIIQAFSALRLRLKSSQPFISELEVAVKHVDKILGFLSPHLKFLEDYAALGIPTLEQLKEEFSQVLNIIEQPSQEDMLDWWKQYKKLLKNLIVIKKNNLSTPQVKDNTLQTAQAKLAQGDLQGVLSLIEKLNLKEFETWCAHAAARSQVELLLPQLDAAPLSILLKEAETPLSSSFDLPLIPLHKSK